MSGARFDALSANGFIAIANDLLMTTSDPEGSRTPSVHRSSRVTRTGASARQRGSLRLIGCLIGCLLMGLAYGCGGDAEAGGVAADTEPGWEVDRSIYTEAQADLGRELFVKNCTNCHEVATFTDPRFLFRWGNGSVGTLYRFVSSEMPINRPGQLESDEYLAILAHFLRLNHMPAGAEELGSNGQDLDEIILERRAFFD